MSADTIIKLASGGTGALAILIAGWILLLAGRLYTSNAVEERDKQWQRQLDDRDAQIAEKNEAIRIERDRADSERRRADVAVEAAQTSNILLASITGRRKIGES